MKKISVVILGFLFFACSQKVTQEKLVFLNGYWEIEKVTFADGQTKDYTVNESIDFIKMDSLKGFRKKVSPTFNGTYITNDAAEFFTIYQKENLFFIHYKTELSDWTEHIESISKNNFSVTNEDNRTFFYKRYESINISK
tara:strand:+ start:884 stop:1303 length:420 start_codon:yes stop_codon:yes gene_type:complete